MKSIAKKLLSGNFRKYIWENYRAPIRLARLHWISFKKFIKYNSRTVNNTFAIQRTILMLAHTIEKGFSLPETRPFFGVGNINALLKELEKSKGVNSFPVDVVKIGVTALLGWVERHEIIEPDEEQRVLMERIRGIIKKHPDCKIENKKVTHKFSRSEVEQSGKSLSEWIHLRHSVRDFSQDVVPEELVKNAVRDAQRAPSACNLQPTRVYTVSERSLIEKILTIQSGSNGFKESVPLVFVLTFEVGLQAGGPRSRNQGYCDTGMFAMLLMLSLLEKGIASCPLNWAKEPVDDSKLRELVDLPESQQVVLLVGAGMMKESFEVACSNRRELACIMRLI
ncbi:nitroreductase family protein [Akkermansiaceae bacterium]|nr:nitroreductase family protein [Akkermansiaceae bacterium]MDA7518636.1 nitroreductase family protein [Akkermansiaceae bacterium]MDA7674803.1 nitroreductase family protein [Akkermansiaceae bacterium]MDB4041086.1 nitroreductase family protein [Akkermansiaceae bacterium]MDB4305798.1 nitroreductase family protein [Akkermansiaceae bacterium]